MSWSAIKAVLRQETYVTRASWEVIFDVFLFTFANVILFGFVVNYLVQDASGESKLQIQSLLIAVVFWEGLRISQYSISVSSMWNIWSHNLSNMFIAPIKPVEYMTAHIIAASVKSIIILIICALLVWGFFDINILDLGWWAILFSYLNFIIFGTALGLVLVGLVLMHGTKVQALTWGTIFMIQPFCAVYFPVDVLPAFLQPISYIFPATYFFEWIRSLYIGVDYSMLKLWLAFAFNLAWLGAACFIFSRQLASAKRTGQFVRTDL